MKKVKNSVSWILEVSMVKKLLEHFYGREMQKATQNKFRIKKVSKRKDDGKAMIIHSTAGLIWKI